MSSIPLILNEVLKKSITVISNCTSADNLQMAAKSCLFLINSPLMCFYIDEPNINKMSKRESLFTISYTDILKKIYENIIFVANKKINIEELSFISRVLKKNVVLLNKINILDKNKISDKDFNFIKTEVNEVVKAILDKLESLLEENNIDHNRYYLASDVMSNIGVLKDTLQI